MKRRYLVLLLALGTLVLFALTPVGPWAAGRIASWSAAGAGWDVAIEEHRGSLLVGFSFVGVRAVDSLGGVQARVGELRVAPWDYAVWIDSARVVVDLRVPADSAAAAAATEDTYLPIEYIPDVRLKRSAVRLVGEGIEAEGALGTTLETEENGTASIRATWQAVCVSGDSLPVVEVSLELRGDLRADRLDLDTLVAEVEADTSIARLDLSGWLQWSGDMPLELRFRAAAMHGQGAKVDAVVALDGGLRPLALDYAVDGRLVHSALDTSSVPARVHGSVEGQQVVVDTLDLRLWSGGLQGSGVFDLEADSVAASLSFSGIDLARVPASGAHGSVEGVLASSLVFGVEPWRAAGDAWVEIREIEVAERKQDFRLEAAWDPTGRMDLNLGGDGIDLHAGGTVAVETGGASDFDFELAGILTPRRLLGQPVEPVSLKGALTSDRLEIEAVTPRIEAAGGAWGPMRATATVADWQRLQLEGSLEEGLVEFKAFADLQKSLLDSAVVLLRDFPVARLAAGATGQIRGRIRAAGGMAADSIRVGATLAVEAPAWEEWRMGDIRIGADYAEGRAAARLEAATWRGDLRLVAEDLQGNLALNGRLAERGTAGDSLDFVAAYGNLQATVDLGATAGAQGRVALDSLQSELSGWRGTNAGPLQVRYAEEGFHFDQVAFNLPTGRLRLSGRTRGDSLGLEARAELDLKEILPAYGATGRVWADIGGSLQRPVVEGGADLKGVHFEKVDLGRSEVRFALADSAFLRASLQDAEGAPHLEVDLRLPAAPLLGEKESAADAAHLAFNIRPGNLDTLLSYIMRQPVRAGLDVEGDMRLPLSLVNRPLAWDGLDGALVLRRADLQMPLDMDSLRLALVDTARIALRGDHVVLEGLRLSGERYSREWASFRPAGSLDLGGSLYASTPSQLSLDIRDVDLRALGGPDGGAWLRARVAGTAENPRLEAEVEVNTLDLGLLQGRVDGNNDGGHARVAWQSPSGDSLNAAGLLPWALQEGRVDWDSGTARILSSGVDLASFEGHLVQVEGLGGRVGVDMQLSGFSSALQMAGHIQADSLRFALPDIEPAFLLPRARVAFEGDRARLADFAGRQERGTGRFVLEGGLNFAASDSLFDLKLTASDVQLRLEDTFRAPDIDAEISFAGGQTRSLLSGRLQMEGAVATPALVEFNAPPVPPPPPTVEDEFLENMHFDLGVEIRDLKVDSELARADLGGGLEIGGTFYKPTFQGGIDIAKGYAFLLGHRFDFTRGRIGFNRIGPTESVLDLAYDPTLLDPDLDIEAITSVTPLDDEDEYEVTLSLQGRALGAVPEFHSDPILDTGQILYLLAFNTIDSGSNTNYTARALGTTAGQLIGSKVSQVGFDEFSVLPSGAALGTVNKPSILVGKYFKNLPLPLWVRYEAALAEISAGEVRVERRLNSYMTVTGSAQSAYDRYGVGIGLKKEY